MNLIAPVMATVVSTPLRALRALADLPDALERSARDTRQLVEASYARLEALQVESARGANAQVAELRAEIARLGAQLERVAELVEPRERSPQRSERLQGLFRRAPREA